MEKINKSILSDEKERLRIYNKWKELGLLEGLNEEENPLLAELFKSDSIFYIKK